MMMMMMMMMIMIIIIVIIQGKFLPVQVTVEYKECIPPLTLNAGTRR